MVWITNITPKPFLKLVKFLSQYVTVEIFKNGDEDEPRLISGQITWVTESDPDNPTLLFISRAGTHYTLHANKQELKNEKEYWFLNRMSAPPGMDDLEEGVIIYSVPQLLAAMHHD